MTKENDIVLNQLQNPTFNAYDFKQVGLDISNTSIADKNVYKELDFVKSNPLLQTNGAFDEAKFDALYDVALDRYNQMAQNEVAEEIGHNAEFFRDNIYAPKEQRTPDNVLMYQMHRTSNPARNQQGVIRIDLKNENPLSLREIAETQRVWDEKTQSWQEAPNDSFLDNWTHTRVLAQWDADGEHVDPITGEVVQHKKGEKRLNDNGTYYYENLNGRSVYGREVLSKFDTLTTDGSAWNKFDFLDSDDKKKSFAGNLFKNALKIVPAFIPGIAPYYIGLRVGINTMGLMATIGNMITGNNCDLFHGIEAYTKSMKTSQSDWVTGGGAPGSQYETPHAWSLESIMNIAGDVFTQLAEQRWIFKYPMAWLKGKDTVKLMESGEAQEEWVRKLAQERFSKMEGLSGLSQDTLKRVLVNEESRAALISQQQLLSHIYATEQLKKKLDAVQNTGKIISMAYMTGVTVQDSYGEALQEGASPIEAALLSVGYAAGEYAIINSDLGKWILPELKHEQQTWKQIGRILSREGLSEEALRNAKDPIIKNKFIKKYLGLGKGLALSEYKTVGDKLRLTAGAMIGNALGEGVEETSEELLYDVTKSLFNLGASTFGSDTRLSAFDNGDMKSMFNRYALSFVGGVIGGGLGEMTQEYRNAASLSTMTKEQAVDQLIQICKEGKGDEFKKIVDKTTWAPKNLTWEKADTVGNFKPVGEDKSVSQDATTKTMINRTVDIIQDLLNADGTNLMDEDVLKKISGSDNPKLEMRAATLRTSKMATKMLESYNIVLSDLIKEQLTLAGINDELSGKTASNDKAAREAAQNPSQELLDQKTELETAIKFKQEQLQEYLEGKKAPEFIKKALFEVTVPLIGAFRNTTFAHYAEEKYHKKIADISDADLETAHKEWEELSKMEGPDLILSVFNIFENANNAATPILQQYATKYFDRTSIIGQFADLTVKYLNKGVNSKDDDVTIAEAIGRYSDASQAKTFDIVNDPIRIFTQGLLNGLARAGIDVSTEQQQLVDIFEDLNNGIIDRAQARNNIVELLINNASTGLLQRSESKNEFLAEIRSADYISEPVRQELLKVINRIAESIDYDSMSVDYMADIRAIMDAINNNPNRSPIVEFIDSFALTTKTGLSISELIQHLENSLSEKGAQSMLDQYSLVSDEEEQLDNALQTINLAKAIVNASRTDSGRFGDIFGYNATVNEITPDSHLAELDSNTADTIVQELDNLATRLKYYKTIAEINSGNRLKEHEQTGVKVNTILYDTVMTHIVERDDFPPDDWDRDSINELKATLGSNEFAHLKSLRHDFIANSRTMNLNIAPSDAEAYQLEVKKFEDALHKFFKANEANIKDTDKLAKFLDIRIWGSDKLDASILNKDSESIAAQCTIWWLASIAAEDPSVFNANYHLIFGQDENLAPVAGQELAVKLATAAITNGEVFAKFAEAQNKALLNYIKANPDAKSGIRKEGSPDYKTNREAYYKKGTDEIDLSRVKDSSVSVDFLRTVLVEGIAGSGKSTGVAKQIIRMLMLNDTTKAKVLSNVWITHTSKEKAFEFAKSLFGEEVANEIKDNCFSHQGLMQTISGTNAAGRSWNETLDAEGKVKINSDDLILVEGQPVKYNYGVKTSAKMPTLIITDEVSHLSLPSLAMVDEFAEKCGIHHLAFGDYDQSGNRVTVPLKDLKRIDAAGNSVAFTGDPKDTYEAYAYNTNFIHTPKLGQSLRSANKLKDVNNLELQKKLDQFRQGYGDPAMLQYLYNPEDGYLGDYLLTPPNSDTEYEMFKTTVIDLLNRTKAENPNAKVGYIYRPLFEKDASGEIKYKADGTPEKEIESRITKILRELNDSEEYKGMIDFKSGNAAQGDENPYYILDFENIPEDDSQFISDLYTGITRAQKASIILNRTGLQNYVQQHAKVESAPKFSISQKTIKDFTQRKKALYEKVYGSGNGLDFKKFETPGKTLTNPTTSALASGEDVTPPTGVPGKGAIVTDGTTKYKILQYNKDDKDNYTVIVEDIDSGSKSTLTLDQLQALTLVGTIAPQGSSEENAQLERVGDVDNSNPNVTQMEHHTFNMDETGVAETNDAYTLGTFSEFRYDNVLGILKLIAPSNTIAASILSDKGKTSFKKNSREGMLITQCLQTVRRVRAAGRYGKSSEEIIRLINKTLSGYGLSLPTGTVARFAYKVRKISGKSPDASLDILQKGNKEKFILSEDERVTHLISNDPDAPNTSEQVTTQIVMVLIDADGKEILETPICCDTNPVTLALSSSFGKDSTSGQDITTWVQNKRIELKGQDNAYMKLINALQAALQNPTILGKHPQAAKLLKQIELFKKRPSVAAGGAIQFLTTNNGKDWLIPGRDWKHSGVIINTTENISSLAEEEKYANYEGDTISYENLQMRGTIALSKGVFMVRTRTKISKNGHESYIDPGKPFIIVSDNIAAQGLQPSDSDLAQALFDTNEPSTTFVYIEPQTAGFVEYFQQMEHKYGTVLEANEDTAELSADDFRAKYGDIGNSNTPYRILKELLATEEGKNFVRQRITELYPISNSSGLTTSISNDYRSADKVIESLETTLKRLEAVENANTSTGIENALYEELHKSFADLGFKRDTAPAYSRIGVMWSGNSNTGTAIEHFLRALVFGNAFSMTGTNTREGISFKNTTSAQITQRVNTIESIIKTNPDTKFKNGIHRHASYYRASMSSASSAGVEPETVNVGTNTLYYTSASDNTHKHYNPITENTQINGKLDTGVLKTSDEQATNYEQQKENCCNMKNDKEAATTARNDINAYKQNNMKDFLEDTPRPVGPKSPSSKKASSPTKGDLIISTISDYVQLNEYKESYIDKSVQDLITDRLRKFDEKDISKDTIDTLLMDLRNTGDLIIINSGDFSFAQAYITKDELTKRVGFAKGTVTGMSEGLDGIKVTTSKGSYLIKFEFVAGKINLTSIPIIDNPGVNPKNGSSTGTVRITNLDGNEIELKDADTVFDKLGDSSSIKTYLTPSAITGLSSLECLFTRILPQDIDGHIMKFAEFLKKYSIVKEPKDFTLQDFKLISAGLKSLQIEVGDTWDLVKHLANALQLNEVILASDKPADVKNKVKLHNQIIQLLQETLNLEESEDLSQSCTLTDDIPF